MIIQNDTLEILKNFSEINQSILIKQNSPLVTINEQRNVFAKAVIGEAFPVTFAIYDLHKFLGVLSLFKQPSITFKEKSLLIESATNSDQVAEYQFADESMIQKPPEKSIVMPDIQVEFDLEENHYNALMRAASIMNLPDICVEAKQGKLKISASDSKQSVDNYSIALGNTSTELTTVFKIENFKMLKGSYHVKLASSVGYFKNNDHQLEYWIASEKQ